MTIPDFTAVPLDGESASSGTDAWKAALGGADAPPTWDSPEGIGIRPLYTADDTAGLDFLGTYPGIAPFLRGPYPTMYTTQPWTVRQYAGFSTAEESNAFYRRNLAAGQKGLSIAFDLATHRGYDSDHPRVAGDVGMAGVAIDSIYDMRQLFDGIPLDTMSVSMTMNGAVLPVLALYVVAAEEQGVPHDKLTGTIQNDILKEFMVRNTYIYPPAPSMQIISDIFAYTSREMPKFNSISISGYHIQEAGATADLELAYTLADGVEYLRAGIDAGLDVDAFAPRLSFFWAIGMNFFMEVAKLRAARLLWAKLLRQFDPRNAQVAVAAHPLPDLGLVADRAGRVQQRGAHLRGGDGRDPGPHPVAAHQRPGRGARAAHGLLRPDRAEHPAAAGAGVGHHEGDRPVGRQPLRRAPDLRPRPAGVGAHHRGGAGRRDGAGDRRRHPEAAGRGSRRPHPGPHRLRAPAGHRGQQVRHRVRQFRQRDRRPAGGQRRRARPAARQAAPAARGARPARGRLRVDRADRTPPRPPPRGRPGRTRTNLLALAIAAARAKATVGEISDSLEKVFGRHAGRIRIISGVYAKEAGAGPAVTRAREAVTEFAAQEGRQPRILVAKMGQDGHDRGQKVIATAFADLGFDVDVGPLFSTPGEVARQAVEADVHVVGVSSLAAGHLTLVPELRAELARLERPDIMVVVGGVIPPADVPTLHEMGAAAVFGPGTVIAEAAVDLLAKLSTALHR